MATFNCSVVTPSESVLEAEVAQVEFPQWDGSRGILAGAAPFVAKLGAGRLRIQDASGKSSVYMLAGGFAEMHDNTLVLVADEVIAESDLDVAVAEARLVDAVAAVTEAGRNDPLDRERLEMARTRATVELSMAKEKRN